jgi:hypothetical protein
VARDLEFAFRRGLASHVPDKSSHAATIYLKPFALGICMTSTYILEKSVVGTDIVSGISTFLILHIWHS